MTSIVGPIVEAFSDLFEGFGLPSAVAFLIATLAIVGILFLVFLKLIGGFKIDNQGRQYLFIVFFVGLAVLGLIPWWCVVILGLIGIVIVFFQKIQGVGG